MATFKLTVYLFIASVILIIAAPNPLIPKTRLLAAIVAQDIVLIDPRVSMSGNLTRHPAIEEELAWSPDGQHIAFVSNRDGNREIFMMKSNGDDLRQLTNGDTDSIHPAWSPDGKYIAYVFDVNYADANQDIYVFEVESGVSRQLTYDMADDDLPVWSPDSQKIAFISNRRHTHKQPYINILKNEIYVVNVETGEEEILTETRNAVAAMDWSPDGQTIVMETGGNTFLFSLQTRETTTLVTYAAFPDWSPDGEHILVWQGGQICTIRSDTTDFKCLPLTNYRSAPRWSPDGSQIAFNSAEYPAPAYYTAGSVTPPPLVIGFLPPTLPPPILPVMTVPVPTVVYPPIVATSFPPTPIVSILPITPQNSMTVFPSLNPAFYVYVVDAEGNQQYQIKLEDYPNQLQWQP